MRLVEQRAWMRMRMMTRMEVLKPAQAPAGAGGSCGGSRRRMKKRKGARGVDGLLACPLAKGRPYMRVTKMPSAENMDDTSKGLFRWQYWHWCAEIYQPAPSDLVWKAIAW